MKCMGFLQYLLLFVMCGASSKIFVGDALCTHDHFPADFGSKRLTVCGDGGPKTRTAPLTLTNSSVSSHFLVHGGNRLNILHKNISLLSEI